MPSPWKWQRFVVKKQFIAEYVRPCRFYCIWENVYGSQTCIPNPLYKSKTVRQDIYVAFKVSIFEKLLEIDLIQNSMDIFPEKNLRKLFWFFASGEKYFWNFNPLKSHVYFFKFKFLSIHIIYSLHFIQTYMI